MRGRLAMLMVSAAAFAAADTSLAQTGYTNTPTDTIVTNVPLETGQLLTFQQFAATAATLNLSWERISASIPAQWDVTLCDNGNCYPNLPLNGSMSPVPVGDYGLMTLDAKPHANAGTAVVRYAVWETGYPSARDTLTWIVHSNATGIPPTSVDRPILFTKNKTLVLKSDFTTSATLALFAIDGKCVFTKSIDHTESSFDLSFLNDGTYVAFISGTGNSFSQKIILGCGRF